MLIQFLFDSFVVWCCHWFGINTRFVTHIAESEWKNTYSLNNSNFLFQVDKKNYQTLYLVNVVTSSHQELRKQFWAAEEKNTKPKNCRLFQRRTETYIQFTIEYSNHIPSAIRTKIYLWTRNIFFLFNFQPYFLFSQEFSKQNTIGVIDFCLLLVLKIE